MSELKKCPFCGRELVLEINRPPYINVAYHPGDNKEHCILSGLRFPVKSWNTRPIEDKMREEIDRLKAVNEEHRLQWLDLQMLLRTYGPTFARTVVAIWKS